MDSVALIRHDEISLVLHRTEPGVSGSMSTCSAGAWGASGRSRRRWPLLGVSEGLKLRWQMSIGIVAVVGKVNPTELCQWLKRKTKKDVKIVCDPPVENHKQKMILVPGSSSRTGDPTRSAPPLPEQGSWALVPSGVQSDHEDLQLIEEKIKNLEMVRDMLKIKNLENKLIAVKCELKQSRKVINGSRKVLPDSALNQLKAYKKLEALSQSLCD